MEAHQMEERSGEAFRIFSEPASPTVAAGQAQNAWGSLPQTVLWLPREVGSAGAR